MKRTLIVIFAIGHILAGSLFFDAQHAAAMDIKDFVKQTFIHGVPYEKASLYGAADVDTLLGMLSDRSQENYWPNIVVTLCIIGDDRAVDPILAFINGGTGQLSHAQYTAKSSAVMALGYLVNKSGNRKALDFLKASLDPDAWGERRMSWTSPYQPSVADRNMQLSTMAVLGLALSGNTEARDALLSLQRAPKTAGSKRLQARASDTISEALSANQMIAEQGLAEYYRKNGVGPR